MTTDTSVPRNRKIPKKVKAPEATLRTPDLSWAELGLLAYIEICGAPTVKQLEEAATNGLESVRHLLKKLKRRNLIELTRHVDGNKRFTEGTYSLKAD